MVAKRISIGVAAIAALLFVAPAARADAILINGGFESGLTGWETIPPDLDGSAFLLSSHEHSGQHAAWFGAILSHYDSLLQTFDTEPGEQYTLEFWLAQDGRVPRNPHSIYNSFSVSWDDTPVLSLENEGKFGYKKYSFTETALDTETTIKFTGGDFLGFYYLDDVSVEYLGLLEPPSAPPLATPEPATLLLLGVGLTGIIRARRRSVFERL